MHKIICLAILALQSAGVCANVDWVTSNETQRWVNKGPLTTILSKNIPSGTTILEIMPASLKQEIIGWGGCFNERGWNALSKIPVESRDSVLKALFDSSGCAFDYCRTPIGASDYALSVYTLDDFAGDYAQSKFNISRDSLCLIPYIKAALKVNPSLRVWGVPWKLPDWMKASGVFCTPQMYASWALYYEKYVQAYQRKGIPIVAVHIMNEPCGGGGGVNTVVTGEQMRILIRDFLGPLFARDSIKTQIWHADINCSFFTHGIPAYKDSIALKYITGIGLQYNASSEINQVSRSYPSKYVIESEAWCGDGKNAWAYGWERLENIRYEIDAGANAYMQWNMVLADSGDNIGGWKQNAMITIDTVRKKVSYNPQWIIVRHFSHFIRAGARRCEKSAGPISCISFVNPNGDVVLVGRATAQTRLAIKVGQDAVVVDMPAGAHTFVFRNPNATKTIEPIHGNAINPEMLRVNMAMKQMHIRFSVSPADAGSSVRIQIYDLHGRLISSLVNGTVSEGDHAVAFDSRSLPENACVCRMKTKTSEKNILFFTR